MSRIFAFSVIASCCYAAVALATEPNRSADKSSLEGQRQAAYDDWKQGRLQQAAESFQEISEASALLPGPGFAQDLHSTAVIYSNLGRYQAAKQYYYRELDALKATGNQVAAGVAYGSLATIFQIEGAFAAAETSYKNAVELLNRYADRSDIRTANVLNRMGWLYTLWGRTRDASRVLQQAEEAARRSLKPDDPDMISFLDVRASFLTATGRYAEAEKLWQKALRIGETAYPNDIEPYDEIVLHLGQLYSAVGDHKPAEQMFRRFLAIDKPVVSMDAMIRAVATAELARLYTQEHQYGEAEPLFSNAIQMIESQVNKIPVASALIRTYFGDYYMARSKWSEAEAQYRNAVELRQAMLGQNAPDVAASMFLLSNALGKLHRRKEAEQYKSQAVSIAVSLNDPLSGGATVDVRAFRPN